MKTRREIIEEVYLHFRNHPEKLAYESRTCLYLTDNGNKCAVGLFLIDGKHQEFIGTADELIESYGLNIFKEEYKIEDLIFWNDLQTQMHDSIATSGLDIEEGYKYMIDKYGNN